MKKRFFKSFMVFLMSLYGGVSIMADVVVSELANVAKNKSVEIIVAEELPSSPNNQDITKLVDGNDGTMWAILGPDNGGTLSSGECDIDIIVDLEQAFNIKAIKTKWGGAYAKFEIYYSLDGIEWNDKVFSSDNTWGGRGELEFYDSEQIKTARYIKVKLYELVTRWGIEFSELKVYSDAEFTSIKINAPTAVRKAKTVPVFVEYLDQYGMVTDTPSEGTLNLVHAGNGIFENGEFSSSEVGIATFTAIFGDKTDVHEIRTVSETSNIALNKKVTLIGDGVITGNASKFVDGSDAQTTLSNTPKGACDISLIVDLEKEYNVDLVELCWGGARADFEVYYSTDGENWGEKKYEIRNLADAATHVNYLCDTKGTNVRYIKMKITRAATGYGVIEFKEIRVYSDAVFSDISISGPSAIRGDNTVPIFVEYLDQYGNSTEVPSNIIADLVFGEENGSFDNGEYTSAQPGIATFVATLGDKRAELSIKTVDENNNIALNKSVELSGDAVLAANVSKAVDGKDDQWTVSNCPQGACDVSLILDLGKNVDIDLIDTSWGGARAHFEIYYSTDGMEWGEKKFSVDNIPAGNTANVSYSCDVKGIDVRFIKIQMTAARTGYGIEMREMRVYVDADPNEQARLDEVKFVIMDNPTNNDYKNPIVMGVVGKTYTIDLANVKLTDQYARPYVLGNDEELTFNDENGVIANGQVVMNIKGEKVIEAKLNGLVYGEVKLPVIDWANLSTNKQVTVTNEAKGLLLSQNSTRVHLARNDISTGDYTLPLDVEIDLEAYYLIDLIEVQWGGACLDFEIYYNDQNNQTIKVDEKQYSGLNRGFTQVIPDNIVGNKLKLRLTKLSTAWGMELNEVRIYAAKLAVANNDPQNPVLVGSWNDEQFSIIDNSSVTSYDMTAVSGITTKPALSNPNCLLVVDENSAILDEENVVVLNNGSYTANQILLTENNPFDNSFGEITADKVSYTRSFSAMAATTEGWASLYLPFSMPIPTDWVVEEFVKYEEGSVFFKTVEDEIQANTPYIIKVVDEFTADNEFEFANESGSIIPASTDVNETVTTDYTFKGTFKRLEATEIVGCLGLHSDGRGFGIAGENSFIPPFRAYLAPVDESNPNPVKYFSLIHDDTTGVEAESQNEMYYYSANGVLEIHSNKAQSISIYGMDGRLARVIDLNEGYNPIYGLGQGIYLINNQKVIVK